MSLRILSATVFALACWNSPLMAQFPPPSPYKVSKVDLEQGTISFQKQLYETVTRMGKDGKKVVGEMGPATAMVEMTWKSTTDKAVAGNGAKLDAAEVMQRVKAGTVILHVFGAVGNDKIDPNWQDVLKPETVVLITKTNSPVGGDMPRAPLPAKK